MSFIRSLWRFVSRPSQSFALGTLVVIGAVGGVVLWGGFNWAMELSSTETFCISCHEMESTVYQELKTTVHYKNPYGVRATCPDCHVPKPWVAKVIRKVQASFNEVPKHFLGYIDTREKFEAHRLEMAEKVWAAMKASNSRECRNCHSMSAMDLAKQRPRARGQHEDAATSGETCIDCHKGIAHKHVHEKETEEDSGGFMLQ
jgi:nitrate/TMAO reductase-like tetraheme cytochrome c subunit